MPSLLPVTSKTADEKITAIDKKIEELKALKKLFRTSIDSCNNGCGIKNDEANCPLFELQ